MNGGGEPGVVARAVALAGDETDERKRAEFAYHTRIFADRSADPGPWHKALEGWAVVKSPTMEQTRTEGRAEGRILDRQEALLEALAAQAKQEVPADLAAKVRACADLDQLRAWFTLALKIDSLEAFRQQTGL